MWINSLVEFIFSAWYWAVLWTLSGVIPLWVWAYAQIKPVAEFKGHWLTAEDTFVLLILTVCCTVGGLFLGAFIGGIAFIDKGFHKKQFFRTKRK